MSDRSALGYVVVERVARVEHRCHDCGGYIDPGQRYRSVTAQPGYDFNPNPGHWTRAPFHFKADGRCIAATTGSEKDG